MIRTIELPKDNKSHDQVIGDVVEFERNWAESRRKADEAIWDMRMRVLEAQIKQFEEWDRKDKTIIGRFLKWWEAL